MAAILDIKSASAAKREKLRKAAYKAFTAEQTAHSFARIIESPDPVQRKRHIHILPEKSNERQCLSL